MNLEEMEQSVKELKNIIEKGEIDSYTVNTFTTLCGKVIEELNKNGDDIKQFEIMNMMKNILQMEQVSKLTEMERNKDKIEDININKEINKDKKDENKNEINQINIEDKKEEKKEEDKKEEKKELKRR